MEGTSEPSGGGQGPRVWLGKPLDPEKLLEIERTLNLTHHKWDTRVAGACVLSPQPLLIEENEWGTICREAERAAGELLEIEREIAARKPLQELIGLPRRLRKLAFLGSSPASLRTLRFDFHPTMDGWVISEVNCDVPGGFAEAALLPDLYKDHLTAMSKTPSPLRAWGDAVESQVRNGHAALLYSPGFLEDEQVVRTLGRELRERGFRTVLIQSPSTLRWNGARAELESGEPVDVVVRFYQAEWLAQLPRGTGWKNLFADAKGTAVINPGIAAVSESKRLPLCFERLRAGSETLRRLMPECREPPAIETQPREDWVLKAAYSNTGDEVHLGAEMSQARWSRLLSRARWHGRSWVAQRRFETLSLPSLSGPLKPCVGVFVIGGRAAGAYVRLSRTQVTDGRALEAPLFLANGGTRP